MTLSAGDLLQSLGAVFRCGIRCERRRIAEVRRGLSEQIVGIVSQGAVLAAGGRLTEFVEFGQQRHEHRLRCQHDAVSGIDDGRVEVEIRSHNEQSVAGELAGFGALVEVLEPAGVRDRLAVLAGELSALYAGTAAAANSAIDVNRQVGETSPAGVAVAPVPPFS